MKYDEVAVSRIPRHHLPTPQGAISRRQCSKREDSSHTEGTSASPEVVDKETDIVELVLPTGFTAASFYSGIPEPDGIAVRDDGSLLVVNEGEPQGVFLAKRGDMFNISDAFSTIGPPFESPDDILLHPDGAVFVADGNAGVIFKIPAEGGLPSRFLDRGSVPAPNNFSPFGLALSPPKFHSPDGQSGKLIIADNGFPDKMAVWIVDPSNGDIRAIAMGRVFSDGPLRVAFSPNGELFVYQNTGNDGMSRIVSLTADGRVQPFVPNVPDRGGLTIHPLTGNVYFGLDQHAKEIWWVPAQGGEPSVFASGFTKRLQDIEFAVDGQTLFVSVSGNVIEITGPFHELISRVTADVPEAHPSDTVVEPPPTTSKPRLDSSSIKKEEKKMEGGATTIVVSLVLVLLLLITGLYVTDILATRERGRS